MENLFTWGRIEVLFLLMTGLLLMYKPPSDISGVAEFIERHFGDAIGFYILHLGILLIIVSAVVPQLSSSQTALVTTGNSLIMAAMVALKLKTVAPIDGNGNGNGNGKDPKPTSIPAAVGTTGTIVGEEKKE